MRIPGKKILRICGLVSGGMLLVLCLAVAGVFIWLRTDFGERFVADFAAKTLAEQGLFLTVGGIDGPLPSRILLTNVQLADGKGVWFTARELECVLSLSDLFRATAAVTLVWVDTPELFRLPELPPQAAPQTPPAEEPETVGPYFSLPVAFRLDRLNVDNLGIHTPLVFPEVSPKPEAAPKIDQLFRTSFQGTAMAGARQPLTATLLLSATADMPALHSQVPDTAPLSGFSLITEAKATVGEAIDVTVTGTTTPEAWEKKLPLKYGLQATVADGALSLPSFFLKGLGLHLETSGNAVPNPAAATLHATLRATQGGAWEQLAARLGGLEMGGDIAVSLDASLATTPEGEHPLNVAATLDGTTMHWGMEQLQSLVGQRVTLRAAAEGSATTRFDLHLQTLETEAITASGNASFAPKNQSLSAALTAALSDLAAAVPGVPGLEGAVRATLNASGTLAEPAATLEIASDAIATEAVSITRPHARATLSGALALPVFAVEVTGDSIRTHAGELKQFRAGVEGRAGLPDKADKKLDATLDVTLGASPAGPVALHAAMEATQKIDGAMHARLHDLALTLAGTNLAADITAALPASGPSSDKGAATPAITGTASAAISDWKPLAALSGLPLTGSRAGVEAAFSHEAAVQHITASLRADSLSLPDAFAVNGLSGIIKARLEGNAPAKSDIALDFAMGKGEAGPVAWRTGAAAVSAKQGKGLFAAALRADTTAEKAVSSLAKATPAQAAAPPDKGERLTVAGSFSLAPMRVVLDRLAARLPRSPMGAHLTAPATLALDEGVTLRGFTLAVLPGKGSLSLDAALTSDATDLTASITELPFRLIREAAQAPVPDGALSARAVLAKKGATVRGTLDATATVIPPPAENATTPPVTVTLASTLDQRADPHFPALRSGGGISRLKGSLNVGIGANGAARSPTGQTESPRSESPKGDAPDMQMLFNVPLRFAANGVPEPAMAAPLGATMAWQGEVAPLWALVPMPDRKVSGLARIDAAVKGSMGKPEYALNAYLANGRFEDGILGVLLTNITLEAANASSGESKLLMRAEDGMGGHVALEGALSSPQQTAGTTASSAPHITARGQVNHLQPLHRDDIFLRLSGRLSVNGPLDAMQLAADMEVERGELSIANLAGGVRTLDIVDVIADPAAQQEKPDSGPVLDVKVAIPNRFYVRGRGLDSEWAGNLAVRGGASSPSLTGSLKPVRGSFDLMSRNFAFSGGDIAFMGGDRIDPGLNLSLTYDAPNIVAIVRATGTASKPEIRMESQPALPQDQIMAEVLFGKEFSKLSRFETIQVANSLRQLANIGGDGLDPLATMRTKLGVDMLRVGSTEGNASDNRSVSGAPGAGTVGGGASSGGNGGEAAATPTLEAGKYINDAIYVGVAQGTTADSTGVRIEVELRPNLSLQGKTTSNSSQVGLGWKKDY